MIRTIPKQILPESRLEDILARTFDEVDTFTSKRKIIESSPEISKSAAFSDYSIEHTQLEKTTSMLKGEVVILD